MLYIPQGWKPPDKTFNEQWEILIRKMVMKNIEIEQRTDSEIACVVKDIDGLIFDIMTFIEDDYNRKR